MGCDWEEELSQGLFTGDGWPRLLGRSGVMRILFEKIRQVAAALATTILVGETGTGKELVARAIHAHSPRQHRPFVAVNCSALSDLLLESELFGHVKGSFSWATKDKAGLVELADGGTLFLDEVADMSPQMQAKLLRFLESGHYWQVGGLEERQAYVRIIAATNQNLEALVRQGQFREDLFYRLKVVVIEVPPLRDRREDIPILVEGFLRELSKARGIQAPHLAPEARSLLEKHDWKGNVRELRHAIEAAIAMQTGDTIGIDDLKDALRPTGACLASRQVPHLEVEKRHIPPKEGSAFEEEKKQETRSAHEKPDRESLKEVTQEALRRNGWNKSAAARDLGIDRKTLRWRIETWGLHPGE